jgi:uncharacterized protein YcsI (UPF0317 family)
MNPDISPKELRQLIRSRKWTIPTSGAYVCFGSAQRRFNDFIIHYSWLVFYQFNPRPHPQ